jgi:hypothetical protein
MFYRQQPDPPQVRHRCRNPRCGGKLSVPTEDRRAAFCCPKCEAAFYKVRCRVCEAVFSRKTVRRVVCWRSKCRHELQRHPERFALSATPIAGLGHNGTKSPMNSGLKNGAEPGRGWRIVAGPPVHPANLLCLPERPVAKVKRNVLIQKDTPPVNIIGGYKFPGAPKVDLSPPKASAQPRQLSLDLKC